MYATNKKGDNMNNLIALIIVILVGYAVIVNLFGEWLLQGSRCAGIC